MSVLSHIYCRIFSCSLYNNYYEQVTKYLNGNTNPKPFLMDNKDTGFNSEKELFDVIKKSNELERYLTPLEFQEKYNRAGLQKFRNSNSVKYEDIKNSLIDLESHRVSLQYVLGKLLEDLKGSNEDIIGTYIYLLSNPYDENKNTIQLIKNTLQVIPDGNLANDKEKREFINKIEQKYSNNKYTNDLIKKLSSNIRNQDLHQVKEMEKTGIFDPKSLLQIIIDENNLRVRNKNRKNIYRNNLKKITTKKDLMNYLVNRIKKEKDIDLSNNNNF